MGCVLARRELIELRKALRQEGKRVVFTNGCFDILHRGHIEYLKRARVFGDVLIVAVNSDLSVRRLKGEQRPIIPEEDRAEIVASLGVVDYVTIFDEDTPYHLILDLVPDVLVKGADWKAEEVVGRDVVEAAGGRVVTVDYIPDRSTTRIIETVRSRYC
ncbi:MAG: D-glycero-beta-D-manno-heptose 1-phosphate adenylyltransferase [Bacteroidota bacterium]